MKTYVIRNWDDRFENAESRKYDSLRWVPTPNAHDGLAYTVLITQPDGPALYGCWNAILQLASRGDKQSRGRLEIDGMPLTLEDIALLTRMPEDLVARTIEMCCSPKIGWMQVAKCEQAELPLRETFKTGENSGRSGAAPGLPESAPESPERMERRERTEGKGVKEPAAPKAMPPSPLPLPPQASLPLSPSFSVVQKTENADPVLSLIPEAMRVPEFVAAIGLYREHLRQKGCDLTPMEWQTVLMECHEKGFRRSILSIDFTLKRCAKRLIWDEFPRNYKPLRCKLPKEVAAGSGQVIEPEGFREWLEKVHRDNKGKGLVDFAPHLRASILEEFWKAQRAIKAQQAVA